MKYVVTESISIFDMIKIGIGPSSSHTMGPWRAALQSIEELQQTNLLKQVESVTIQLYGSLSKTGAGHGTYLAIVMGLTSESYLTTEIATVRERYHRLRDAGELPLAREKTVSFQLQQYNEPLPAHPNGMTLVYQLSGRQQIKHTYYSIGGGFILSEEQIESQVPLDYSQFPYPIQKATDLLAYCQQTKAFISAIVWKK